MNHTVVKRSEELPRIANEIMSAQVIAIDLETTSRSPHLGDIRILSVNTGQGIYVIDLFETRTLGPVLDALRDSKCVKVGQNLKFDQAWLLVKYNLELKPIFDTFRASALLYNGKKDGTKKLGNNLYDIYKRELGMEPQTKDLGGSNWAGSITDEQYAYAADDVVWMFKLRELMKEKLAKWGLNRVALIEFQAILPEAAIECNGFRLDPDLWMELYRQNQIEANRLEEELTRILPHPDGQLGLPGMMASFNIGSTQQLQRSLALLGVELTSTSEQELAMNAHKLPELRTLIKYKKAKKLCESFGPEYLENINKVTGRVHASYYPFTGAGRYSCVAPWTLVTTAQGSIPIEAVRVGDMVLTHKGRWRRVLAHLPQGSRESYDVRLSNGDTLTCTDDHRLLLSDGNWATVKEIRDEYFKEVDKRSRKSEEGSGSVPESRCSSHGGHSAVAWNDFSQCSACDPDLHGGAGEEGASGFEVLSVEARVQESHVGEERGTSPQLEGFVRRWVRVSDLYLERQAGICAPYRDDGSAGSYVSSRYDGCASYRLGQAEQQPGQPGAGNDIGAPRCTLHVREGQPIVEIEAIDARGSLFVYDISVEEDESYETCGVFSHNCSDPNLQQIPRNKNFRACFTPGPGKKLVIADYSQIELRLVAEISRDKMMTDAYKRGEDIHRLTAALVNGVTLDQVTKEQRQMAKAINFGLIYGIGPDKLVIYSQTAYGVTMSRNQAEVFRKKYFEAYPGIAAWHKKVFNEDKRRRMTRTLSGRMRFLEDPNAHNEFANTPVQGSGADGLKCSLKVVHERLKKYDGRVKMVHMVHDEIILECDDEPELLKAAQHDLEQGMVEGIAPFMKNVPVEAEGGIGDSWADK
jgi:DNA polymerase I-like protein with 3'-5' exonuclease and polymerase domains